MADHQNQRPAVFSPDDASIGVEADFTVAPPSAFASPKDAARALLLHPAPQLHMRSGQFCGGLMFSDQPLTEKQERWLTDLLRKHGLPPLADGGE